MRVIEIPRRIPTYKKIGKAGTPSETYKWCRFCSQWNQNEKNKKDSFCMMRNMKNILPVTTAPFEWCDRFDLRSDLT